MPITLTKSAAERIKHHLAERKTQAALRFGVRKSGCSGLAYVLEYVDDAPPEQTEFVSEGVRVLVDPAHLRYVDGTRIDYVSEGLSHTFRFHNPNVADECGCGESFTTD